MYTISAEIKTQTNITVPKRLGGSRIKLLAIPAKKWAMTKAMVGTTDWSPVMKAHAEVADGSVGTFRLRTRWARSRERHGSESSSWAARFPPPLETYLLYPNYRGMMFSDQSQVARVADRR